MSTGKEVATVQGSGGLALRGDQLDWTEPQRAALAQIGIDKAPPGDQQVFLHVAQRVGLDPFAKQIYLIGRKDDEAPGGKKWTIQTAIDGFRVFSERHHEYAGDLGAEWCGEDGVWRDVWTGKEPPVAARFTVLRRDREHPITAVAHYSEYVVTKFNGQPNHIWKTKPAGQIAKCAEALARRRAFPQDLASVYTDDEMGHVDNPPPVIVQSERDQQPAEQEPDWDALIAQHEAARDVGKLGETWRLARGMRPNDTALLERIAAAAERVKTTAAAADASTQPANKSQMNKLFGLLSKGGITSDEHRHRLASHYLDRDITSFKDLTADDISQLITALQKLDSEGRLGTAAADTTPAEQPDQQPADQTEGDRGDA